MSLACEYDGELYGYRQIWQLWTRVVDDGWRVSLAKCKGRQWCCDVTFYDSADDLLASNSLKGDTPFCAIKRAVEATVRPVMRELRR